MPFQAEPDVSMIPPKIAQPPAAVPEVPKLPPDADLATSALARKDTTQLEAVGGNHQNILIQLTTLNQIPRGLYDDGWWMISRSPQA